MTDSATSPRARARRYAATLAALGALALLLITAAPASAHAVLVASSPQDGARVSGEPASVALTFDEAVQPIPSSDEVINTSGTRVDAGQLTQTDGGATIVMPLKPGLPDGTYTVTWRVVSADTHIVSGSISFGIGVDPSAAPAAVADHTRALDITADIAQGFVYLGLVLMLGVATAAAVLWRWIPAQRRTRILAWSGWATLTAGTALALFIQGPRAENDGWPGVWHLDGLGQTVSGTFGRELLARLLILILAIPFLLGPGPGGGGRTRRVTGSVLGLALLVAVALTGHASVGPNTPLAMLSAVAHLAAMAVWLGGLTVLLTIVLPAARRGTRDLSPRRLRTWSVLAYCCIACLVVSGEYQAARQISPIQALWSTEYGVTLLIKAALIAATMAAAYPAQRRVLALGATRTEDDPPRPTHDPHLGADSDSGDIAAASSVAATAVRRSVRIEAALAAVILAVTAVLVSEPPASTSYGPALDLAAPLGPDTVHVHIDTTKPGPETYRITVADAAGRPIAVQSLDAQLSSATLAALDVRLTPPALADRLWQSTDTVVPTAGLWTLTLDVAVDATDAYATAVQFEVW